MRASKFGSPSCCGHSDLEAREEAPHACLHAPGDIPTSRLNARENAASLS